MFMSGTIFRISLPSKVSHENIYSIKEHLLEMIPEECDTVIVSLRYFQTLNSSTFKILIGLRQFLKDEQRKFYLSDVEDACRAQIRLMNLDKVLVEEPET
ncbi:MAG: STAS domain-containing protein [Chitinivibrionales bacterium]|nr:STAS domain-containing protein [Chitinivibrionales bacterium]